MIALLSLLAGAVDQYYWPGFDRSPADWVYVICGAMLIFVWYRIDSKQRHYKTSPWLDIAVFAVAIAGLPYYFFRSRGLKGGFLAALLFVLGALASSLLSMVGKYAAYYALRA